MTDSPHFIDNKWLPGTGKKFSSHDPSTGEKVWEGVSAGVDQVDLAVNAARKAFTSWALTPIQDRISAMTRFGEQLQQNKENLAIVIATETGKPMWESRSEVESMIAKIDISIQAFHERTGTVTKEIAGAKSVTRHKPHGVVVVFGPFNFPGHLPNGHIVPALLAGNTVIFKPSRLTPLVAQKTIELWQHAGLPAGSINLLQGTREMGNALVSHPGIDGLFFTGSSQAGRSFHRQFAGEVQKILALEMGGNNALIVEKTGDLNATVYTTLISAYISSGQRCTCARRLLVPNTEHGETFLKKLTPAVTKIRVGRFDDTPEPFMGPVISEAAADQLLRVQETLTAMGGIPLVPMKKLKTGTGLIFPGLMDVSKIEAIPDEEYFGPFLQVIRYDTFDEALQMANDTRFGLAAGLLSDDESLYHKFLSAIRAGVVNWNKPLTGASSGAPFGGIGLSGNHHPSAYYAADYCSYPVASMETKHLTLPGALNPGIIL